MVAIRSAIILQSELNTWINICIVPHPYENFSAVKYVAEKAFEDWFDEDTDEPIGDYIKRKLDEAECEYEIYYGTEEEEDI